MDDMPYPYYRLQADGPDDTGITMLFQLQEGPGGPLPGLTSEGILDHLKEYLAGDRTTVRLSLWSVAVATDL
ncbi:hypothetical protein G3I51_23765 [Streptomyces sp. SID9944]|nr:hypothetical protein [Streptomyces sp. SID9944]